MFDSYNVPTNEVRFLKPADTETSIGATNLLHNLRQQKTALHDPY